MSDFLRFTGEQTFEWGSIRWYFEPDGMDTDRLSVAIATYLPAGVQPMHSHYREEQVLYVISGIGVHTMNGKTEYLRPGSVVHLPSYTEHGLTNFSAYEELKVLLVYSPSRFMPLIGQPRTGTGACLDRLVEPVLFADEARHTDAGERAVDWLSDAEAAASISAAMERLSQALGLSLALLDIDGGCIFKTANHPRLCRALARLDGGAFCRRQMKDMLASLASMPEEKLQKPHFFTCCNRIASTIIPVVYDGGIRAYMKCGEIFLSRDDREFVQAGLPDLALQYGVSPDLLLEAARDIPLTPRNRLYTAAEATFAIAGTIAGMAASARRQKELNESRLSLAREQLAKATLEKALQQADLKLLQSQVSPHFLFNTMNTIAQMAYVEDAPRAAELTWSLSELLRATLGKTDELIPLHEEIGLLKNYIHIQQERFGDRISFTVDVEDKALNHPVPCMLFQPLVENAVIHGLEPSVRKGRVSFKAGLRGGLLRVVIEDDGVGFEVDKMDSGAKRIGLRGIQSRLEHYFGAAQRLKITSAPGCGTRVLVEIRVVKQAS